MNMIGLVFDQIRVLVLSICFVLFVDDRFFVIPVELGMIRFDVVTGDRQGARCCHDLTFDTCHYWTMW